MGAGRPGFNREAMLKKFDKNGDGKLDETERQAARAEMMKNRGKRAGGKGKGKRRPNKQ